MPSVSIVLPTLDERDNLERLVPELLAGIPGIAEVLVVDDGSTDGTVGLVERMAGADARVRLVRRPGPPSLTAALRDGIAAARGDLVGWMDADLIIPVADVARLAAEVTSGADLAIGTRFGAGGVIKGQRRPGLAGRLEGLASLAGSRDGWVAVALSWGLNVALLPAIVGLGVHDYTSGILVGRAEAVRGLELRGRHGEYFIELWAQAARRGLRVTELPYRVEPRRFGRSKTAGSLRALWRHGPRYLRAALAARRIVRGSSPSRGSAPRRGTTKGPCVHP